MERNENKNNRYSRKPVHDFKATISEDGRFWIFKDITTWIIPRGYLDKINETHAAGKKTDTKSAPKGV